MLHIALISLFFAAKSILGQNPKFLHPLTNRPGASKDISTRYFLPVHQDKKFPIGKTSTILCHISNDGKTPYNVTAVMGSLNQAKGYFFIQNYSYKTVGILVQPGEELSLHYDFEVHKDLDAMEYQLSHTVFYSNERHRGFSTTFFNEVRIYCIVYYIYSKYFPFSMIASLYITTNIILIFV